MGPAAGKDVRMDQMQTMYHTRDADIAFPPSEDQESLLHSLAKWSLAHRDLDSENRKLPSSVSKSCVISVDVFVCPSHILKTKKKSYTIFFLPSVEL